MTFDFVKLPQDNLEVLYIDCEIIHTKYISFLFLVLTVVLVVVLQFTLKLVDGSRKTLA